MKSDQQSSDGILWISNEADRVSMASILYKNGYAITPVRVKKNGRAYEYGVKYSRESPDIESEEKCSNSSTQI